MAFSGQFGGHKPRQLWVPRLGPSRLDALGGRVARDVQRAFRAWRGENFVYLLPELEHPCRWQEPISSSTDGATARLRMLAIPAEHLERLDVCHVGPSGHVWGPSVELFPGRAVDDLLDMWIGTCEPQFVHVAKTISFPVPVVQGGSVVVGKDGVVYENNFPLPLGSRVSVMANRDGKTFTVEAPMVGPPGPEAVIAGDGVPQAADGVPLLPVYPPPFDHLAALLDGWDLRRLQERMRDVVRAGSRAEVLAAATELITPAEAPFELAVFWPTWVACGAPEDNTAFWEELGINARTLHQAARHPMLQKNVPVLRTFGLAGLLWSLVLERLDVGAPPRTCEWCGAIITGRRNKRACSRKEKETCWKGRQTWARAPWTPCGHTSSPSTKRPSDSGAPGRARS